MKVSKGKLSDRGCCSNSALTLKLDDHDVNPRQNVSDWSDVRLIRSHGAFSIFATSRYGRKYILKSLDASYSARPEWQRLLFKEFELGIRLDHPGIARTIAWETIPGIGEAIVMEYVEGVELQEWLKTQAGSERQERRDILPKIADALVYIHSMGISHRDLKPDNILITNKGNHPKIIDFGLGDGDDFVVYKKVVGTKRFGAPEQQEAGVYESGMSADIYSLGKIMAMLRLGWRYKRLIRKCLRIDESKRPSATEVLKALNRNPRSQTIIIALVFIGLVSALTVPYFSLTSTREQMNVNPQKITQIDTIYINKTDTVTLEVPSKPSDSAIQAMWDRAIKDVDPQIKFYATFDFPDKEDHTADFENIIPDWQDHLYYNLLGIGCTEATAQAKRKELGDYMHRHYKEFKRSRPVITPDSLTFR